MNSRLNRLLFALAVLVVTIVSAAHSLRMYIPNLNTGSTARNRRFCPSRQ